MKLEAAQKKYRYIKSTGQIILLESNTRHDRIGKSIGSLDNTGYIRLNVGRKSLLLHRFAWFLVTGKWPIELDHKNNVKTDNRWCNLRNATRSKNRANSIVGKNNKLGIKGVRLHKKGLYEARFNQKSLGYFVNSKLAAATYASAAKKHFGEFARLR